MASLSESHFWDLTPGEVDEILHEAIEEWRAKDRSAAYNAALICSVLCNCHRDSKAHPEPFTPDDFLPKYGPPPKPPTQAEVASKARNVMDVLTKVL